MLHHVEDVRRLDRMMVSLSYRVCGQFRCSAVGLLSTFKFARGEWNWHNWDAASTWRSRSDWYKVYGIIRGLHAVHVGLGSWRASHFPPSYLLFPLTLFGRPKPRMIPKWILALIHYIDIVHRSTEPSQHSYINRLHALPPLWERLAVLSYITSLVNCGTVDGMEKLIGFSICVLLSWNEPHTCL